MEDMYIHNELKDCQYLPYRKEGGSPPSVGELDLFGDSVNGVQSIFVVTFHNTPIYLNYPHTRLRANFSAYFTILLYTLFCAE